MSDDVAKGLSSLADVAAKVAPALAAANPIAGVAAGIAAAALKAGSAIAAAGKDPVVEITRILSAKPEVKEVHTGWDGDMDDKFGPKE